MVELIASKNGATRFADFFMSYSFVLNARTGGAAIIADAMRLAYRARQAHPTLRAVLNSARPAGNS